MSLQLHSLLIACGGFTPVMHTYLLSPISPPPPLNPYVSSYTDGHTLSRCKGCFFFFFNLFIHTGTRPSKKRLCTCDSSPWNQGHLRGRSMFFCSDELPPTTPPPPTPYSFHCLFDQVLSGCFDQQLIASDWPRCALDSPACD